MRKKHRSQWRVIWILLALGLTLSGCSPPEREEESPQPHEPPKKMEIAFIGNSYTFYNDLPAILVNLAREGGHDLGVDQFAEGGWTLEMHAASKKALKLIKQRPWDYVVLQEQSVIPSVPAEREQHMVPAIRLLHAEIEDIGAETILFVTWGHRDGMPQAGYSRYADMQAEITRGYMEIATQLDLIAAPVGEAWQRTAGQDAEFELWHQDGSHPSLAGSYLAACVFYAVVFQESPEGLGYAAGLDEKVAGQLQSIAAETVLKDPARWNIK